MTDSADNSIEDQLENDEVMELVSEEPELSLYSVEFQVQSREFKGQVSGLTKCALSVHCNALDEFKHQLWLKINDKLKREIVFDETNSNPQWHENISPTEEDMDRFVLFYDSKSKRTTHLSKITTTTLHHWRLKEIWLYIHVYSTSVSNLSLWKKVQKNLIEPMNRDRAGASTVAEMNVLVGQLKEIHRYRYQSNHINWMLWANRIQASAPHLREQLIRSPPPADMLHFFALAKTVADDTITELRQNLCIAEDVNDGTSTGLSRVRDLFYKVRETQKAIVQLQNEQQSQIELLDHELKAMEIKASTTRSLLNSVERAAPASESNFGRRIFSQIEDQEDVDHV